MMRRVYKGIPGVQLEPRPKCRLKHTKWTDEEITDLLHLWKCHMNYSKNTFLKVAESMKSRGHTVSWRKCSGKVTHMVHLYRKAVNIAVVEGTVPQCQCFDVFEGVFHLAAKSGVQLPPEKNHSDEDNKCTETHETSGSKLYPVIPSSEVPSTSTSLPGGQTDKVPPPQMIMSRVSSLPNVSPAVITLPMSSTPRASTSKESVAKRKSPSRVSEQCLPRISTSVKSLPSTSNSLPWTSSEISISGKSLPEVTTSGGPLPEVTASGESLSGISTSGIVCLGNQPLGNLSQVVPRTATSRESLPRKSTSGKTLPRVSTSRKSLSVATTSEKSLPGTSTTKLLPGISLPEGVSSEMHQSRISDSSPPRLELPSISSPRVSCPGIASSNISSLKMSPPEITAPEILSSSISSDTSSPTKTSKMSQTEESFITDYQRTEDSSASTSGMKQHSPEQVFSHRKRKRMVIDISEWMERIQEEADDREDTRQQRLLEHETRMEEKRQQWEEQRREREMREWRERELEYRRWEEQRLERDAKQQQQLMEILQQGLERLRHQQLTLAGGSSNTTRETRQGTSS